jgi:hypothetical protein
MTEVIRNLFSAKEWEIIAEATEEYGYLGDEDYADECGIIVDKINAILSSK